MDMDKRNRKLIKLIREGYRYRRQFAKDIGMHEVSLYQYVSGRRGMSEYAKNQIADGLSKRLGRKIYTNEF